MMEAIRKVTTSKIIELQDENGCWNVLKEGDKYYPQYNYYAPNYKSTLWTLVLLADVKANPQEYRLQKPLNIITKHFFDEKTGIFTIGKSHFPIPCLNGNMMYLLSYFKYDTDDRLDRVIDFFYKYQRFDEGDYKTPSDFPYGSNKSCYGQHTCYWGVVKLLKGLSFIPLEKRSEKAIALIERCIDFILQHEVCYSSHNKTEFLHTNIKHLTFPNMYQCDFLEILWLLKREKVNSESMKKALNLLESKMQPDGSWKIERSIKDLIIPLGKKNCGNEWVTDRASDVIGYYGYSVLSPPITSPEK